MRMQSVLLSIDLFALRYECQVSYVEWIGAQVEENEVLSFQSRVKFRSDELLLVPNREMKIFPF
jgi:hypothetical protein